MVRYWTPELLTGDLRVDEQHLSLFRETEAFAESLATGVSVVETSRYLSRLTVHILEHFDDEEALMNRAGFPGLPAHRIQHLEFAERVHRFQQQWRFQKRYLGSRQAPVLTTVISVKLYQRVCDWLVKHVATSDQQFARWQKCRGCTKVSAVQAA